MFAASLLALLLLSSGCELLGGSGSEIPAPSMDGERPSLASFSAIVGSWRNQPPAQVPGALSGAWSGQSPQLEATFSADGSARLCWLGKWDGGHSWLESAEGPICSRSGSWQPIARGVGHDIFRVKFSLLEGPGEWYDEVGHVGFSVDGDSMRAWPVRVLKGNGALVGGAFRDADDPADEYHRITLTSDGRWIAEVVVDGAVDIVDTSLYERIDSTTLVRRSSAGADPDTLLVEKVGGGYAITRLEHLREARLPGHQLLRQR